MILKGYTKKTFILILLFVILSVVSAFVQKG